MRVAPIVKAVQHLEAGEWKAAHVLVQKDGSSLGCWAHGIVHLIEGDLDNAKYWYRRAHRPLPHGNTANAEIAALKATLTDGAGPPQGARPLGGGGAERRFGGRR